MQLPRRYEPSCFVAADALSFRVSASLLSNLSLCPIASFPQSMLGVVPQRRDDQVTSKHITLAFSFSIAEPTLASLRDSWSLPARSLLVVMWSFVSLVVALLSLKAQASVTHATRQYYAYTNDSQTTYSVQRPPLDTPWTYDLGKNPWPEYPRPQLQRSDWRNLNGIWKYRNASGLHEKPPFGKTLPHEVLIPSCLESALSGIQGSYAFYSWFSHNFTVPHSWGDRRVLLNFGAVDYEATVYVSFDASMGL